MNILIVGMGAVGTIHGWALSEAGVDVTHVVRGGKSQMFDEGVVLDVLDLRPGHTDETYAAVYRPKVVEPASVTDGFELLVVATKAYQSVDAVRQYEDLVPSADIMMFTANWEGTAAIDELIPRARYLWGYSAASGGHDGDVLYANVRGDVRLGELDGSRTRRLESVIDMFAKADIIPDLKDDIVEWLWVHHAVNAGTIGAALFAGGIAELVGKPGLHRDMALAVRDALAVLAKRGVEVRKYPEAATWLDMPLEQASAAFEAAFVRNPIGHRTMKSGHFKDNPEEMKRFYLDVVETGDELGVPIPVLGSWRSTIEAL